MKAFVCKEFDQLKESEKKRILDVCNKAVMDEVISRLDEEIVTAQTIWIRMAVVNLSQCGFTDEQIKIFLGSWRSIYRKNSFIKSTKEQNEWLDGRLNEIFGDSDWIAEYIETLKQI